MGSAIENVFGGYSVIHTRCGHLKCPRFCKCLRFLKSGFAQFSDFVGHQK